MRRGCILWCGNEELNRASAQSIAGSCDAVVNWVPCSLVGISGPPPYVQVTLVQRFTGGFLDQLTASTPPYACLSVWTPREFDLTDLFQKSCTARRGAHTFLPGLSVDIRAQSC